MIDSTDLLEALPVAVYTTDATGRITSYNSAAATLWGHRPELGTDKWCGSWKLFWPDGTPLPHDQCPMATTLREGKEVRGVEAVAERPDGTRIPFMPYPTLLRDRNGAITGAVNLLVDLSDRNRADRESARLAAIVASSDDAIISKTLDGRITSWNAAATRIFGYEPNEIIGQHITTIIPLDLRDEENTIVAKLKRGERLEHFDTIRLTKDGRRIDISLTVSPLFDRAGRIIGASKVARDVTERKQTEALQRLLFDELNHRVKNTLATVQSIASQSLQNAANPADFVDSFGGRIEALARAHNLLVEQKLKGADLMELVREQVLIGNANGDRVQSSGPVVTLDPRTAVQLGLVLHELATNARKHGALSTPGGRLDIEWELQSRASRMLKLRWRESGVESVRVPAKRGFGSILIERTLEALGGESVLRYGPGGVSCEISLPLPEESDFALDHAIPTGVVAVESLPAAAPMAHHGKRVLVVEDEPLLAMDLEATISAAGYVVIGPAPNLETARRLIATENLDAALLDGNLAGHPVDELALALKAKAVPFAFVTGYGREALPAGFRDWLLLTKPFNRELLLAELARLSSGGVVSAGPVPDPIVPEKQPA
jgi:PAS domain S-box-containing protein